MRLTAGFKVSVCAAIVCAIVSSSCGLCADTPKLQRCSVIFDSTLSDGQRIETPFDLFLGRSGILIDSRNHKIKFADLVETATTHYRDEKTIFIHLTATHTDITALQIQCVVENLIKHVPKEFALVVYVACKEQEKGKER